MAESLHLTDTRGVLMGDVTAGSPAAQAGIQRGDVMLEMDGQRVENSNQLRLRISSMAPGTSVHVKLLRDGAEKNVTVKLADLPADAPAPRPTGGRNFNQSPGNQSPGNQNPGYQNPGSQNPRYQSPGNQAPGNPYPGQGYSRGQDPGVYRGQPSGPAQSYSHDQDPGTYRGRVAVLIVETIGDTIRAISAARFPV